MELECGPGSPRVPPLQLLMWVPPPALSPAGPRGWLALVSLCFLLVIAQSCPTLRNPMDCSPPGSSVHEILPARTLEWDSMTSMIFQGIFPTQGSNPRLLRWQADSLSLSPPRSMALTRTTPKHDTPCWSLPLTVTDACLGQPCPTVRFRVGTS